mmetsp:Transcript_36588/g.67693  ORF Transcript_36588/g.67693 Transcript_36588/m.67693 type:complete len:255 (-) Transcript_36588:453-1217(-)|eukprot:CAMPEP_0197440200 /NCGR_PEP_ID=MMETSP1175-20131217/6766_1 /TAXON_ID=1003142 /ORGANISM="Triceratium dubium, Strain CCMP147" /LENGTH=254 /DNA_ID=CAMNT_0042970269 /DNA_START=123 /DNA_END=887 /DNA_ORIENTATION=+
MPDVEAPPPAGEETPLVPFKDDDASDGSGEPLEDIQECTNKEKAVGGLGGVAFAASIAAMVVEVNPIVYLSGVTGAAVAPYSAFQQQKITDTEALEETNEALGEEVNKLKEENDRLEASVGQLETSVENLRDLEETLETIKKSETKNIDQLEKQLEEQKAILSKMKGNLKSTIMQNLLTTLFAIDLDGDMILSDDEIDLLITKIENLYGVDLKDDMFRAMIVGSGRDINAVMEILKNLMDESIPEEERIFTVRE